MTKSGHSRQQPENILLRGTEEQSQPRQQETASNLKNYKPSVFDFHILYTKIYLPLITTDFSLFLTFSTFIIIVMPTEDTLLQILLRSKIYQCIRKAHTLIQRAVYWKRQRWGYLIFMYAYVLYRIFRYEYLGLMYILGLYVIYLIVQYLTPSGLPDPDEDEAENTLFLEESLSILKSSEGDRPVLRSLNEFNLWKSLTAIGLFACLCTCFQIFLVPVYWPFLLIYFIWLIGLAVAKHYKHMKKYGYNLADFTSKPILHTEL